MANARKLTDAQIDMLRVAAKGQGVPVYGAGKRTTRDALLRRDLIECVETRNASGVTSSRFMITPAGRAALFEATGENTAPEPEPARYGSGSFDDPAWDDPRLQSGPEHISKPLARALDKIKGNKP